MYPMLDGDSIKITKIQKGYIFDASNINSVRYCAGNVAKTVIINFGKKGCIF